MKNRIKVLRAEHGLTQAELADRLVRLQEEVRPGMIEFIDRIASRVGVAFRLPTPKLLDVFEALFFFGSDAQRVRSVHGLIGPVAVALADTQVLAGTTEQD